MRISRVVNFCFLFVSFSLFVFIHIPIRFDLNDFHFFFLLFIRFCCHSESMAFCLACAYNVHYVCVYFCLSIYIFAFFSLVFSCFQCFVIIYFHFLLFRQISGEMINFQYGNGSFLSISRYRRIHSEVGADSGEVTLGPCTFAFLLYRGALVMIKFFNLRLLVSPQHSACFFALVHTPVFSLRRWRDGDRHGDAYITYINATYQQIQEGSARATIFLR